MAGASANIGTLTASKASAMRINKAFFMNTPSS
jgi:hypothetical protein